MDKALSEFANVGKMQKRSPEDEPSLDARLALNTAEGQHVSDSFAAFEGP